MPAWLKYLLLLAAAGLGLFLLIQLIPVQHSNPPVVTTVKWDSSQTQALFQRSCADCHSNETTWPWYSYVAPVSWLVAHDVQEGRQRLNLSDLAAMDSFRLDRTTQEISRVLEQGSMPPAVYMPTHPNAALSAAEAQALATGLTSTINASK